MIIRYLDPWGYFSDVLPNDSEPPADWEGVSRVCVNRTLAHYCVPWAAVYAQCSAIELS